MTIEVTLPDELTSALKERAEQTNTGVDAVARAEIETVLQHLAEIRSKGGLYAGVTLSEFLRARLEIPVVSDVTNAAAPAKSDVEKRQQIPRIFEKTASIHQQIVEQAEQERGKHSTLGEDIAKLPATMPAGMKNSLVKVWTMLEKAQYDPPDDEQVKWILDQRRMKKYGEGL